MCIGMELFKMNQITDESKPQRSIGYKEESLGTTPDFKFYSR